MAVLVRRFRTLVLLSLTTLRAVLRAGVTVCPTGIGPVGPVGTVGGILCSVGFLYREILLTLLKKNKKN